MQEREIPIVDSNEVLEPSKERRRQAVRVRPVSRTSDRDAGVSARKYSMGRFRPRKQETREEVSGGPVEERKALTRPRMRRPPSVRSSQERFPSPPVIKSIKRMRVRARTKPSSTALTQRPQSQSSSRRTSPLAQRTTLHKTPETSTSSSPSSSSYVPSITTEVITISPDAHKIRFTLDRNEVTSELPILRDGPNAERLVSKILIPDDVFRQETYFNLS